MESFRQAMHFDFSVHFLLRLRWRDDREMVRMDIEMVREIYGDGGRRR
jgi:hypothetical protein